MNASVWLAIVGAGVVTYATRLSFILWQERLAMPAWVERALRFAPVAVLSAIILPELLVREGALLISPFNARLIAGIIAALVAWRTRNIWLTIAVGMLTLWTIGWIIK